MTQPHYTFAMHALWLSCNWLVAELQKRKKLAPTNFLPQKIRTKKWPKNDLKLPKKNPKLPKLPQKWPKIVKMVQNDPKISTGQEKIAPTGWTGWHVFATLAEMWIEIGVKLGNINFHFSDVNCVVLRQKRFPYLRCCTIDRSCRQDTTTIRRPGSTNNRGKGAAWQHPFFKVVRNSLWFFVDGKTMKILKSVTQVYLRLVGQFVRL